MLWGIVNVARMVGRGRRVSNALALMSSLAALSLAASASPAAASVTIGQLAPIGSVLSDCGSPRDRVQPTVTSGNGYVVPVAGTITSWSIDANANPGQMLAMKVWRRVAGSTYTAVGHDGPRNLISGTINTFPASVAVKPGDVLGLGTPAPPSDPSCSFAVPGETYLVRVGDLADGESGDFNDTEPGYRLNITAVVAPTNAFTLGDVKRNKKKGTATLTVDVPNPGELTASGKGASASGAAVTSKAVTAGPAQLLIRATGKKKRKLKAKGKVKLNLAVNYTPTGGDLASQSIKVKLKKKLTKKA
jgi:hypothetical protein